MKKLLSAFSITGNSDSTDDEIAEPSQPDAGNPFDGLDPKQANVVMKELESSMAGMDDDNPDPKQMGSLMRKMCDLTGEKMDNQMEEVVRKLEEGMDPNALEDQMGDLGEEQGAPGEEVDSITPTKVKKAFTKKLTRDPKLYEFVDFIKK
ncbi:MAG: hypothetical protein P8N49_05225 [Opitutales bacterium]|nr:hypothetical protein [Opitutales bacterium]